MGGQSSVDRISVQGSKYRIWINEGDNINSAKFLMISTRRGSHGDQCLANFRSWSQEVEWTIIWWCLLSDVNYYLLSYFFNSYFQKSIQTSGWSTILYIIRVCCVYSWAKQKKIWRGNLQSERIVFLFGDIKLITVDHQFTKSKVCLDPKTPGYDLHRS